jgi:hypothetical protein
MKILSVIFILTLFTLSGCVSSPKQVTLSDGSQGLSVRCNGMGVDWSRCYETAKNSCPSGFDVKDREQYLIDNDLPIRVLHFKCK